MAAQTIPSDIVMLPDYVHRQSYTCRSGNIRDILENAGHNLSEAMLFGLSNSLFFTCRLPHETVEATDYLMMTGLWHDGIHDLVTNLALDHYQYVPADEDRAWQHIRNLVADGHPVMLEVVLPKYMHYLDVAAVPGFRPAPPPQEGEAERNAFVSNWDNFFSRLKRVAGTHMVVVVGLDEAENKAYVIENNLSKVQTVPLDVLKYAANPPEDLPLHPQGRYSTLRVPKALPSLERAIRNAIGTTAHRMLYTAVPGDGVPGVERLAREIRQWPDKFSADVVANTMCLLYYISEKASGGGMYRRLYGRFLHEAAELLADERIGQAAKEYYVLARKWRQFANLVLAGVANPAETLRSQAVNDLIHEIAVIERRAASILEAAAQR